MNLQHASLMAAPSYTPGWCVVCGRPNPDAHHVVPRSQGGHDGPRLHLCGMGNTSGCHGAAHSHTLHFRWSYEADWWQYLATDEPVKHERALEMSGWTLVPRGCD